MLRSKKNIFAIVIFAVICVSAIAVALFSYKQKIKADEFNGFTVSESVTASTDDNGNARLTFKTEVSSEFLSANNSSTYTFGTIIYPADNGNVDKSKSPLENKESLDGINFISKSGGFSEGFTYTASLVYSKEDIVNWILTKKPELEGNGRLLQMAFNEVYKKLCAKNFTAISYAVTENGVIYSNSQTIASASFFEYSTEGVAYRIINDYYAVVTGYTGTTTEVVIANQYQGYPVMEISAGAFRGSNITSITIPNSINYVGGGAFSNCKELAEIIFNAVDCEIYYDEYEGSSDVFYNAGINGDGITVIIGSGVKKIPNRLFYPYVDYWEEEIYPVKVQKVIFEKESSCKSIGEYAFSNCTSLTSIEIPSSITSIEEGAFVNCDSLNCVNYLGTIDEWVQIEFNFYAANPTEYAKDLHINGELVTNVKLTTAPKIFDYAFYNCKSITSVEIPNSVTSIGGGAFEGCDSLTSIEIPNSVTSIGSGAFNGCDLINYNVKDNIKYLGNSENPFLSLIGTTSSDITTATIDSNCKIIAGGAFYNCSSLTSIEIPNSVTSIGGGAFRNCRSLTSIEIPNSVTSIGNSAFYDCDSLTSIEIPNSVTSIGNYAFYFCWSLTSITIGNSVTSIGNYAFGNCPSLNYVNYLGTIDEWAQIGFSYSDSNPTYYAKDLHINGELVTEVKLTTATTISAYAFYNCKSITSVEIPNSATSIGRGAFYNCSSLTSVEMPNSVTSIGKEAFSYCSSLTSIEIPNGVTSIGDNTFTDCSSLTSIVIPNSVTSIGEEAFLFCQKLKSVVIGDGVMSIGDAAFATCPLTSIEIPNSVTSIGEEAFAYCRSLEAINFKGTVAQWNEIEKSYAWNDGVTATKVICTDGEVEL